MIRNFLKVAVSTVLMLLGLTGLVDNVVVWYGFLADIVAEYQHFRDFVFGLLPFSVADWIKDYLIVGIAVCSSFHSSLIQGSDLADLQPKNWLESFVFYLMSHIVAFIYMSFAALIFWPAILVTSMLFGILHLRWRISGRETLTDGNVHFMKLFSGVWPRLCWISVVFLGALFLFSDAIQLLTFN